MTENAGEVVVASLYPSASTDQLKAFFASLATLRKVKKGFAFRHSMRGGGMHGVKYDVIELMALREES